MDRKSCLISPKLYFARLSSQGVLRQEQREKAEGRKLHWGAWEMGNKENSLPLRATSKNHM